MKQSDYQQFCSIMLETAEAVDKTLSPEKIAVFFKDLADIDIRAFRFAMEKHRQESEYFPRVAKVRELAKLYKPPVPKGLQGRDVKLLESPVIAEDRRQENSRRVKAILASLCELDARCGTNLQDAVSRQKRLDVLEQQKKEIVG